MSYPPEMVRFFGKDTVDGKGHTMTDRSEALARRCYRSLLGIDSQPKACKKIMQNIFTMKLLPKLTWGKE